MNKTLALTVNGTPIVAPENIPTGSLGNGGGNIIAFGLTIFLVVVVLLSLGFIMYGGFNWIMSQGDKTKLESARRTILYAIIGLVIAFFSFFIIQLVGGMLGVNYLQPSL